MPRITRTTRRVYELASRLAGPDRHDRLPHPVGEDRINQPRRRNKHAVPEFELPHRRHGLPQHQAVGGRGKRADGIQIERTLDDELWRRNREQGLSQVRRQ